MNAATSILTDTMLKSAKRRRKLGEALRAIAADLGVTWQKLDKALRHGLSRPPVSTVPTEPAESKSVLKAVRTGPAPLIEKYRPLSFDGIFGQASVVSHLRQFIARPYSCALLFEGETGTGKTSAALALASELGCVVDQAEFGGVHVIASGEQSADAVRDTCRQLWQTPMCGSGWKVVIVNEADRMHPAAETIWLDRLENIPPRTIIVFTTNYACKLSQRFIDRCVCLHFESDPAKLGRAVVDLLSAAWQAEAGRAPTAAGRALIDKIAATSVESGHVSFRRALQKLQPLIPAATGGGKDHP